MVSTYPHPNVGTFGGILFSLFVSDLLNDLVEPYDEFMTDCLLENYSLCCFLICLSS